MGAKANIVVDQGTDFATTITVRDNSGVVKSNKLHGQGQIESIMLQLLHTICK